MQRLTLFLVFAVSTVCAVAQCGMVPMTPMPPMGCNKLEPQCQCDTDGNCRWVFVCVDPPGGPSAAYTWIPPLTPPR